MRIETIKQLCCPFDRSEIDLTVIAEDTGGIVISGFLTCGTCNRIYPIVKGIPIMSPDEYREFNLEKPLFDQWQRHLEGKTVDNFRVLEQDEKKSIG